MGVFPLWAEKWRQMVINLCESYNLPLEELVIGGVHPLTPFGYDYGIYWPQQNHRNPPREDTFFGLSVFDTGKLHPSLMRLYNQMKNADLKNVGPEWFGPSPLDEEGFGMPKGYYCLLQPEYNQMVFQQRVKLKPTAYRGASLRSNTIKISFAHFASKDIKITCEIWKSCYAAVPNPPPELMAVDNFRDFKGLRSDATFPSLQTLNLPINWPKILPPSLLS